MTEIAKRRSDFPILEQKVYNKDLVYLDNAATTQKPQVVIDQLVSGYTTNNSNIHRGVHYLSQQATLAHEQARSKVASFINAESSTEIIFTRGTTESINLVANSFAEAFLKNGDEVILSEMEHHANIVPWQMLRDKIGIVIKVARITEDQCLDMDHFKSLFSDKTKLVSITHISNVLGRVNPIEEIIAYSHERGAKVLIDAAQSIAHIAVDVRALDVDFLVFSGHKMCAPNGVGVLYGKADLLNAMPPYQGGGEMIAVVSFEKTTYNELPFKFEAGTPDYVGSTALGTAIDYLLEIGLDNIAKYEHELLEYATEQLKLIDGMKIYAEKGEKSAVISFNIEGIHHYDLGMLLDKQGVAIRTGHHCAQPLMKVLGVDGTARASFAFYNTKEDVDKFIAATKRAAMMFA